MPKIPEPFTTHRRDDSKTFRLTLNPTCGLPERICKEWRRKSFQWMPDELAEHRNPKTKAAAKVGAHALIAFLKKKLEEGSTQRIVTLDITVGDWVKKFTSIETSPRTGINASKNRPYSAGTVKKNYMSYYKSHIEGDPLTMIKMMETEEEDIRELITRMSIKKLEGGRVMGGTRTFVGVIGFIKMAFGEYQKQNRKWINPFLGIEKASYFKRIRDVLPEDEMLKLFSPGILKTTMELAVCAAMFLSGLRRAEVSALKPEDLDWNKDNPRIIVRRAWQDFDSKDRVLGPPKSKREREAPFDPLLQQAIKKLWQENGEHEFVFCWKDGRIVGANWTYMKFRKWLNDAKIELAGRNIVPHSSRHTLATLLLDKGISLKHIQDLLGHQTLEVTKGYLHYTKKTFLTIGQKITEVREGAVEIEGSKVEHEKEKKSNIIDFKVS